MRATWIDTQEAVTRAELDAQGVLSMQLSLDAAEYQPIVDALKQERGYVHQDIVELHPQTPGLDELCQKFDGEHLHTEDEVRFVLEGEGIFDIRSSDDRWMRVVVSAGDLIVVPADRHHRFELTDAKTIRCVRLFQDPSGWIAHYRAAS